MTFLVNLCKAGPENYWARAHFKLTTGPAPSHQGSTVLRTLEQPKCFSLSQRILWLRLGSLLRWKSEAFQMGRCNALWYRPDLNTSGSRCSWSLHKKPQKPLKPSNIMKHLGIYPQSIIFLNIMAHFNNSILEIFTNNLVTYLYGFALKLWYA